MGKPGEGAGTGDRWMGLGEDRAVEAGHLVGSRWVGEGNHEAQGGLRTGCGKDILEANQQASHQKGPQRSSLGVLILLGQRDKPDWGGDPVPGPGWPRVGSGVLCRAGLEWKEENGWSSHSGPCQLLDSP